MQVNFFFQPWPVLKAYDASNFEVVTIHKMFCCVKSCLNYTKFRKSKYEANSRLGRILQIDGSSATFLPATLRCHRHHPCKYATHATAPSPCPLHCPSCGAATQLAREKLLRSPFNIFKTSFKHFVILITMIHLYSFNILIFKC